MCPGDERGPVLARRLSLGEAILLHGIAVGQVVPSDSEEHIETNNIGLTQKSFE
jgi:hypothetical protein